MVTDAENYAEADKLKKKIIETRNKLDSIIYQAENMLNDEDKKIAQETVDALGEKLEAAKSAVDSDEIKDLESAYSALEEILHAAAAEMYQQQAGEQTNDEPIDVDFTSDQQQSSHP